LDDVRGFAISHKVDCFDHRIDAERKERVEVDRTNGVVRSDFDLFLKQDGAGIDARVHPMDRDPAAFAVL